MKEVIGNNAGLNDQSTTIMINGKEIKDRQRICNDFNNYFINIGPKLAKKFENSLNPMKYVKSTLNSISIPIISESEVVAATKSLKNSSAGYDEVPARILKQNIYISGLGSSTVDQVLKYTKYPKYIPSTSTGQVLIFLKST